MVNFERCYSQKVTEKYQTSCIVLARLPITETVKYGLQSTVTALARFRGVSGLIPLRKDLKKVGE
jgi:hypothetical protein